MYPIVTPYPKFIMAVDDEIDIITVIKHLLHVKTNNNNNFFLDLLMMMMMMMTSF